MPAILSLAESPIEPEFLFIIAGILILIFLLTLYGNRRRKVEPWLIRRPKRTEEPAGLQDRLDIEADMQELLVRLQELARQINAQVDTKFAKMNAALDMADERIEHLERLIRQSANLPTLDVTVTDDHTPTPDEPPENPAKTPQDPEKQRIYDLADAGKSPLQIAKETGTNTGEIELILALRKNNTP